ncbi:hypothetical protein D5086_025240 [Populus alba]|uniref:Uncharacterized protein n=1 Tax=Populus alba TaxID=43335 RepID=A0ACC4AZ42_POPAL
MEDMNSGYLSPKEPLLNVNERCGLGGGNSYHSLKTGFLSRLPDKVRTVLDVESSFHFNVSKTKGLSKDEKEYYEKQFATLKSFQDVDTLMTTDSSDEEDDEEQVQAEKAMKISNYANIVLLVFKVYATIRTGSIAIAASTLDSLLDLMAGGILWFTHISMKNINIYKYPIGKLRMQPVGIIIFAAVMATLGLQILIQAAEELIKDETRKKMSSNQLLWLNIIMISATVVKLALWIYCRSSGNSIVRAYAKDHYFDVVTNVVGLAAAVLGDKYYWWIDPAGAILLAVYTITNWSETVIENAVSLVGQTAPPEVLQKLTYLVTRHPQVKRVDTVRAYTFDVSAGTGTSCVDLNGGEFRFWPENTIVDFFRSVIVVICNYANCNSSKACRLTAEAQETRLFLLMQGITISNVVGLIAAVLGDKSHWWIDPAGAILLVGEYINSCRKLQFLTMLSSPLGAASLVGEYINSCRKLAYLVARHPEVKHINTIRAYANLIEELFIYIDKKRCYEEIYGRHDITYEEHALYTKQINESDSPSCSYIPRSCQENIKPRNRNSDLNTEEPGTCLYLQQFMPFPGHQALLCPGDDDARRVSHNIALCLIHG